MNVLAGLQNSQAVILLFVALIIITIVIAGAVKGRRKGLGWIIGLIIMGILAYLLISGEILGPL